MLADFVSGRCIGSQSGRRGAYLSGSSDRRNSMVELRVSKMGGYVMQLTEHQKQRLAMARSGWLVNLNWDGPGTTSGDDLKATRCGECDALIVGKYQLYTEYQQHLFEAHGISAGILGGK